jgi:hypothetical protein
MKYLALLLVTVMLGCAGARQPQPTPRTWEPISIDAYKEVYHACSEVRGVTCAINIQRNHLSLYIDESGTPEETQRAVSFISTYYCRLSRLEGNYSSSLSLRRPDGSETGRPCNTLTGK